MKDISDKSIGMVFADLPYGTTDCKWDSIIDLNSLWAEYKRIVKKNGVVYFVGLDVAKALGYLNTSDALKRHCKNRGVAFHDLPSDSGMQKYKDRYAFLSHIIIIGF